MLTGVRGLDCLNEICVKIALDLKKLVSGDRVTQLACRLGFLSRWQLAEGRVFPPLHLSWLSSNVVWSPPLWPVHCASGGMAIFARDTDFQGVTLRCVTLGLFRTQKDMCRTCRKAGTSPPGPKSDRNVLFLFLLCICI